MNAGTKAESQANNNSISVAAHEDHDIVVLAPQESSYPPLLFGFSGCKGTESLGNNQENDTEFSRESEKTDDKSVKTEPDKLAAKS